MIKGGLVLADAENFVEEVALGPHDTMNGLAWSAADGANRECFRRLFGRTVVASRHSLLDDLDLAVEASSATLNEGNVSSQTHLVDVAPCVQVVEGVKHHCESAKPLNAELSVLDIGMVGHDLDRGIELFRYFLRDLKFHV